MKKNFWMIILVAVSLSAETLFEVKDASNNKVLDVSTDGIRVMNLGDTLMVISSSEIKANLDNSKGLSRSFSVSTTTSKGTGTDLMKLTGDSTRFWISDTGTGFGVSALNSGLKSVPTNFLHVNKSSTEMREGTAGYRYTDFSPQNMFLGLDAGAATTPNLSNGVDNIFVGNYSGKTNYSGKQNIFIGKNAGYKNYSGYGSTIVGMDAGYNNTGNVNVFIGNGAGYSNGSTGMNTYLGNSTGYYQTSGGGNIYIGSGTGMYKTSGNNNTMVGTFSGGFNSAGSGNVFLGYNAGYEEAGSNKLYIANSSTSTPLIYGDFATGRVGLGTTQPVFKFDVVGNEAGSLMARFRNSGNSFDRHGIRIDAGPYAQAGDHWFIRCFTGDGSFHAGSIYSNNGVMAFYNASDLRLKRNIRTSEFDALKIITGLRIVDFKWIDSEESSEYVKGYIAQEAQAMFPEMVRTDPETGYLGVSTEYLIPILHKAIQEQQEYIKKLEDRIERLESKISQ